MIAAQIENGIVVNMVIIERLDILPNLVDGTGGKIGDHWANGVFTSPPEPPAPILIPDSIAMWQAREEMIETQIGGSNLLDLVYAYFNSLPSPEKEKAISKFEFSSTMRRDDPLLVSVAPTLGLTPTQVAAMFLSASKRV